MANKENIKLWVEALRSGEYEQGVGALHEGDAFCCLGVACEVYQKQVGGLGVEMPYRNTYEYDGETGELPGLLIDWLELNSDPKIGGKTAIRLNDEDRLSFDEIADAIEKEYLG